MLSVVFIGSPLCWTFSKWLDFSIEMTPRIAQKPMDSFFIAQPPVISQCLTTLAESYAMWNGWPSTNHRIRTTRGIIISKGERTGVRRYIGSDEVVDDCRVLNSGVRPTPLWFKNMQHTLWHSLRNMRRSMPLRLVHEAISQGTILQCLDETPITLPTTWSPPRAAGCIHVTVSRRRVVRRTRL